MDEKDFVRGRIFGLNGRVWKAVVLKREGDLITWSFVLAHHPAATVDVTQIIRHCVIVGLIEEEIAVEVERKLRRLNG